MSHETIYAYTPPGRFYPPYINFSLVGDNKVMVTIRSPDNWDEDKGYDVPGSTSNIVLPEYEVERLINALSDYKR